MSFITRTIFIQVHLQSSIFALVLALLESSQLSQEEFYEWIKDRLKSKSEMRDSLMQSLDILFPGTERVPIDDLLAKLSELGETFDETEAAYARMTLEEFDSNNDGAIDKSGNYNIDKLRNWGLCVLLGVLLGALESNPSAAKL